jgi:hypothetical protein
MSFQRVRTSTATHMPRGWAQGVAVIAVLIAMAAAPVVCRGLLGGADARPTQGTNGQSGSAPGSESDDQRQKREVSAAAIVVKQKQIAEDSTKLLKMATELKAEVDKTNKDTLSVTVIRKADAIEKLARQVKDSMKTSMGMN